MTNLELASAMRNKLFGSRGTDVDAAYMAALAAVQMASKKDRVALTIALHVLTNTICNFIEANETGEMK